MVPCDILDSDIICKREAAVIISVMWTIWGSRNSYNHGEVKYQPTKSVELVNELITSLEIPSNSAMNTTLQEVQEWVRPEEG